MGMAWWQSFLKHECLQEHSKEQVIKKVKEKEKEWKLFKMTFVEVWIGRVKFYGFRFYAHDDDSSSIIIGQAASL